MLQTDYHTNTPSLCFLQAGCPPCRPTNSVKALSRAIASPSILGGVGFLLITPSSIGERSIVMSVSVCVFVCPRRQISDNTYFINKRKPYRPLIMILPRASTHLNPALIQRALLFRVPAGCLVPPHASRDIGSG